MSESLYRRVREATRIAEESEGRLEVILVNSEPYLRTVPMTQTSLDVIHRIEREKALLEWFCDSCEEPVKKLRAVDGNVYCQECFDAMPESNIQKKFRFTYCENCDDGSHHNLQVKRGGIKTTLCEFCLAQTKKVNY